MGTGIELFRQTTLEAVQELRRADKVFHLVTDAATELWIRRLNPTAESLRRCYVAGEARDRAYARMVRRILASVRRRLDVCVAFYGHPAVCGQPAHDAMLAARRLGIPARMLPGISAVDCLYADMGLDPGLDGCQCFEATDFLVRRRAFDVTSYLVLWQVGLVGVMSAPKADAWSAAGLAVLMRFLGRSYPARHEVVLYEAATHPIAAPSMLRVPLRALAETVVSPRTTLCVPPRRRAPVNRAMAGRLGIRPMAAGANPRRSRAC